MEDLPGVEYSCDVLTKSGKTLVIVPRTRVQLRAGINDIGVVEKNKTVEKIIKKVIKVLKTDYSINVQLKFSEDGTPKIEEINPRLSGTVVLCTMAGVNLPYLSVKMALGEEIPRVKPVYGTWIVRYVDGICLLKRNGRFKRINWENYYS
jgi:carbamoyl-phosphate synthase large subunit